MSEQRPLQIGIVCFPGVGGSGIVATELGMLLARAGHGVHFISYDRPFRLDASLENVQWHAVRASRYALFRHEDYTLPLAVRMSEVAREHQLDVLHVHYAVPHTVAAFLATEMMKEHQPAVVTTLHGTDTSLIGRDPAYQPVVQHALRHVNALTAVSEHLAEETREVFGDDLAIDVVYNFYESEPPSVSRQEIRQQLDIPEQTPVLIHMSNLRPVKRIDLLLDAFERIRSERASILLLVGGADTSECEREIERRGIRDDVRICQHVRDVGAYLNAADLSIYTSEKESFGLGVLEGMCYGLPTVAFSVGGVPEVVDASCGTLVAFGDTEGLANAALRYLGDRKLMANASAAARDVATTKFLPTVALEGYLSVYAKAMEHNRLRSESSRHS